MNQAQYKLVKFFLDFPMVTPKKLAKAWNIPFDLVRRAAVARDYKHFQEIPDEDITLLFDQLFGTKKAA